MPLVTTVVRTEQLSPSMVRIVLGGGDLDGFVPVPFTDSYVKVLMLHPDVDYPKPMLIREREVPRSDLSISGYWRLGSDDEGWRAIKKDWNREIEESEAQLGR